MPFFTRRGGSVAVVEIYGVIGNHVGVTAYSRLFDTIANSRRYRALLLDIDSPGGSSPPLWDTTTHAGLGDRYFVHKHG